MVNGKRGSKDKRLGYKLPRRAGKRRRQNFTTINMKTIAAMSNYRKGLAYMYRQPEVRKALHRYKIPPVGAWQQDNHNKGALPGWYGEVEHLTNKRVETLMWKTYESKPTKSQLKKDR